MRLLLVRHPAPDIPPGHCYGRLDIGLSPAGEAQLAPLAAALAGIGQIWTSPARRCRRLADRLSPNPVIDPRLQELDFGAWEGQPWDAIPRAALDAWAAAPDRFAPPGGESADALRQRLASFCRDLLHADTDAVVITHGGPLRLLPALLRGEPPDPLAPSPDFAAITQVTIPPGSTQTASAPPPRSPLRTPPARPQ